MASQTQAVLLDASKGYHTTSHRRTHSGLEGVTINSSNDNNNSTHSSTSHNSSKPKPTLRQLVMFYRRRLLRLSIVVLLSLAIAGVYLEFFSHPPPDVLLVMNRSPGDGEGVFNDFGASAFQSGSEEDCEDDPECEGQKKTKSSANLRDPSEVEDADFWDGFLKRNNFVPIGAVYDKCENWRIQYGTVVLLPDREFGGVKSRTFINITLDQEISSGQFNIEVKYNGQELYDNYWDVCEVEDELPVENRTFVCPVQKGKHSKVKDRHIPAYLPVGRYQTKAWVKDESENMIACAYADFKL